MTSKGSLIKINEHISKYLHNKYIPREPMKSCDLHEFPNLFGQDCVFVEDTKVGKPSLIEAIAFEEQVLYSLFLQVTFPAQMFSDEYPVAVPCNES